MQVSPLELREAAKLVGHELSFKEAREKSAKAVAKEGSFDFITFLAILAFKNGFDCAFVLAYSIIMLNTDLHNEKLGTQKRLTKAQFLANNRRSPDLATLSDQYLGAIYNEVLMKEFKINTEEEEAEEEEEEEEVDEPEPAAGDAMAEQAKLAATGQHEIGQTGVAAALGLGKSAVGKTVMLQIGKTGLNFISGDDVLDVLRYQAIELDTLEFDDTSVTIKLMDEAVISLTTEDGPVICTAIFTQANKLLQMIRAAEPQLSPEELAQQVACAPAAAAIPNSCVLIHYCLPLTYLPVKGVCLSYTTSDSDFSSRFLTPTHCWNGAVCRICGRRP